MASSVHWILGPSAVGGPSTSQADQTLRPFQLSLAGFEGPLDLLLRLTEREKLDITTVSLVQVTTQYLAHLRSQTQTDPIALADFVAIGARLLLLKSRSLLPRTAASGDEQSDDLDELATGMREYALYRAAAAGFDGRTSSVGRLYPRVVPEPPALEPSLKKVPVGRLILLMQEVLSRFEQQEPAIILPAPLLSVADKVEELLLLLQSLREVGFFSLVSGCGSRLEVVITFIAILHLIRDGKIAADQPEPFAEILLTLPDASEGDAAP